MASQPVMSIFSNSTETECDFPEPCTPHMIAENGAFYRFKTHEYITFTETRSAHSIDIQPGVFRRIATSLISRSGAKEK